jgi:hypothetical protein
MIKKTIRLRHIPTNQEITAINIHEWEPGSTADGQPYRVLQNKGWSYRELYMPISSGLVSVFNQVKKMNIEDSIDNEFIILDVEEME